MIDRPDTRKVAVLVITSKDRPSSDTRIPKLRKVLTLAKTDQIEVIALIVPPQRDTPPRVINGIADSVNGSISPNNLLVVHRGFPGLPEVVDHLTTLICQRKHISTVSSELYYVFERFFDVLSK